MRPVTASDARFKQFSIEEANRTLPLVRLIVRDIADLHADLHARRERMDDLTAGRRRRRAGREDDPYLQEFRQMEHDFADDQQKLGDLIDELTQIGARITDAAAGAVVFPGREGTSLAWKLGDDDVHLESPDHTLNLYSPPPSPQDADGMPRGTH
jgi:hypothetical protein